MGMTDIYGRKINYLRLSVTDRCNMRCLYCMPASGISPVSHADILSYENLALLAGAAVESGIEKIRVTGGEPLVRKGILHFLEKLAAIQGLKQLVLTTNALKLPEMAADLRSAGVQRLNISLDSLCPETFATITRGGDLGRVLAGIDAADRVGFPIKINMVVIRGVNDHEVIDFAAITLKRRISVRFIEYMPVIKPSHWQAQIVPGDEILRRIARRYAFSGIEREGLAGPATIYRIEGAEGSFGTITPLTGHFCGECNRIRVTATGIARGCLFSDTGIDLKPVLTTGDPELLTEMLRQVVTRKPRNHELNHSPDSFTPFAMSSLGG